MNVVNDEVERKEQFLCIYEDKALIIEPRDSDYRAEGACYKIYLNDDIFSNMVIPMAQFIYFSNESPVTAEDYVALVCGPDFPIEYIRSEDYNLAR